MTFGAVVLSLILADVAALNVAPSPKSPVMALVEQLQAKAQKTIKFQREVVSSVARRLDAHVSNGLPSCPCLGTLPDTVERVDCSYEWAVDGKCTKPTGMVSTFLMYPGDYGELCKTHLEPGHSGCADLSTTPPTMKPLSDQATWCSDKWCYVDPCNCDVADATKSDMFPGTKFYYSFDTCGDKNSTAYRATNTVGNAECATPEDDGHDHQPPAPAPVQPPAPAPVQPPAPSPVQPPAPSPVQPPAPSPAPSPSPAGGGITDPRCQEACPDAMTMMMEIGMALSATSTTPAPDKAVEAMMAPFCRHTETLQCLGATPACNEDSEDQRLSMGAIACICDCPGMMKMASAGDDFTEAICADPGMLDCMWTADACISVPKTSESTGISLSLDTWQKTIAINCRREELGCEAKRDKVNNAECGTEAVTKWMELECQDEPTDKCCPFGETILGCLDKECVEMEKATQKLSADEGDEDAAKELERDYKIAETCPDLGLPTNDAEAAALIPDTTPASASSTTGFTLMFGAALALCAVGA